MYIVKIHPVENLYIYIYNDIPHEKIFFICQPTREILEVIVTMLSLRRRQGKDLRKSY